jgi:hypothetical protein
VQKIASQRIRFMVKLDFVRGGFHCVMKMNRKKMLYQTNKYMLHACLWGFSCKGKATEQLIPF